MLVFKQIHSDIHRIKIFSDGCKNAEDSVIIHDDRKEYALDWR